MALVATLKLFRAPNYIRNLASTVNQPKTAGILVIGDELLKGEVIDTNSPHITKELHNLGIQVKKISIIGDNVNEISNEVQTFSRVYNYVITTGGIGPTHDDVTFEAVAKAFDVPLALNSYLRRMCEIFYKTTDSTHPGMKLAMVPKTAKLNFSSESNYPCISVENVYIFPGIPELFLRSFNRLSSKLFSSEGSQFYTKCVYVTLTEDKISDILTDIVTKFPDVQIGSYPKLFNEFYKVKITIESTVEKSVVEAHETLLQRLPQESLVEIDEKCFK